MTDLPALPTGALVRAARRRDGRPQAAVAGLCGISTDYLSQIERGRKKPSGDVLAKLAAELGVAVGTLLGDDDAPPAKTEPAVTGGAAVVQASTHPSGPEQGPLDPDRQHQQASAQLGGTRYGPCAVGVVPLSTMARVPYMDVATLQDSATETAAGGMMPGVCCSLSM
ncbi:helix-turn-helix domain-containing protein [Streptomyces anulatus]|uniref:helix-turn-helix domain-containing protein n=1 Tax=Streptomyces anulatus TaxID=1892 RepID=UPI0036DD63A3